MRHALLSSTLAAALLLAAGATGAEAQAPDDGWWTWALPAVVEAARNGEIRGIPAELPRRGERDDDRDDRDDDYEDEREREWEDEDDARRGPPHARGERGRRGPPDARGSRGGRADRGGDARHDPRRAPADVGRAGHERRGQGPPFCRNGAGHPVHGWQWCVEKGWAGHGSYDGRYGDRRDGRWLPTRWEDVILGGPAPRRSGQRVAEPTLADILGGVILGRLVGHRDRIGASGDLTGRWLLENGARILQVRSGDGPLAELTDLDGDGRADVVLLSEGR